MIVNVTSGLAIAPSARCAALLRAPRLRCAATRRALRAQLKGTGIHVLEALPPVVDTADDRGDAAAAKLAPEACARQIIAAMESGTNEANVGMVKFLRAVYSISPALARSIMLRF
jgi:uncharacterized oxidoreductase